MNDALGPQPAQAGRGPGVGASRPLSAARARMLDLLRGQPEPLTLAALCRTTGLHENTVREHLDGLVRSGLVHRQRAAPTGRGRPAWLYQAATEDEHSEYARLASALAAGLVRAAPDPETAAMSAAEAGESWGRDLARERANSAARERANGAARERANGAARERANGAARERAGDAPPAERAREQVVHLLDELGFGTEVAPQDPAQVRLTRCPLLQAAVQHPDVVCAVHLGIVRGALTGYGANPTGTELHPFAEPGACRLVVPATD